MFSKVIIVSDFSRPSFLQVGELYADTLQRIGFCVNHKSLTDDLDSSDSIMLQNVVGKSFSLRNNCYNIALVVHEWSRYPSAWIPYLSTCNEVWVTTRHVERLLIESGVSVPVYWIPPALDLDPFPEKETCVEQKPFRFLFVGEWHFRKGLHLLFAAWEKAFPQVGEAELTIKTSADCPFEAPRSDIRVIRDRWERQEVLFLYPEHDAYVTASLGEGWGLPVAEAIRAGLPVVANLWGGHASLLTSESCFPIEHEAILQPFASIPELFAPGQRCGFSSPDSIASAMRACMEATVEERRYRADEAKKHLWKNYAYLPVSARISERLCIHHAQ